MRPSLLWGWLDAEAPDDREARLQQLRANQIRRLDAETSEEKQTSTEGLWQSKDTGRAKHTPKIYSSANNLNPGPALAKFHPNYW